MFKHLQTWIALAIVVLRARRLRRSLMFWIALGDMLAVAFGAWIIPGFLESHLWAFVIFWGLCLLVVLFLFVLAGYDMLMTPREIRAEANLEAKLRSAAAEVERARFEAAEADES